MEKMQILRDRAKVLGRLIDDVYTVFDGCKVTYLGESPKKDCWGNEVHHDEDFHGHLTIPRYISELDLTYKQFAVALSDVLNDEKYFGTCDDILNIIQNYMPEVPVSISFIEWIPRNIADADISADYMELLMAFKRATSWWDIDRIFGSKDVFGETLLDWDKMNVENIIRFRTDNIANLNDSVDCKKSDTKELVLESIAPNNTKESYTIDYFFRHSDNSKLYQILKSYLKDQKPKSVCIVLTALDELNILNIESVIKSRLYDFLRNEFDITFSNAYMNGYLKDWDQYDDKKKNASKEAEILNLKLNT